MTDRNLDHLQPGFAAKVRGWLNDVLAECNSSKGALAGLEVVVLETLRSFARSDELYAQGRKLVDGVWQIINRALVVTNAKGGYSMHNFGLAIDIGIKVKGQEFSWSWDQNPRLMAGMERIAVLAEKHGIEWGGHFKSLVDLPHFQDADAPSLMRLREQLPKGYSPAA